MAGLERASCWMSILCLLLSGNLAQVAQDLPLNNRRLVGLLLVPLPPSTHNTNHQAALTITAEGRDESDSQAPAQLIHSSPVGQYDYITQQQHDTQQEQDTVQQVYRPQHYHHESAVTDEHGRGTQSGQRLSRLRPDNEGQVLHQEDDYDVIHEAETPRRGRPARRTDSGSGYLGQSRGPPYHRRRSPQRPRDSAPQRQGYDNDPAIHVDVYGSWGGPPRAGSGYHESSGYDLGPGSALSQYDHFFLHSRAGYGSNQRIKKSPFFSTSIGFNVAGGAALAGRFNSVNACKQVCGKLPSCLAADYNLHSKRCYVHPSSTVCESKQINLSVIHVSKIPCTAPGGDDTSSVHVGMYLPGGIKVSTYMSSVHQCTSQCLTANTGGTQRCFAVDFDFSRLSCFMHTLADNACPAPADGLQAKADTVHITYCPVV